MYDNCFHPAFNKAIATIEIPIRKNFSLLKGSPQMNRSHNTEPERTEIANVGNATTESTVDRAINKNRLVAWLGMPNSKPIPTILPEKLRRRYRVKRADSKKAVKNNVAR